MLRRKRSGGGTKMNTRLLRSIDFAWGVAVGLLAFEVVRGLLAIGILIVVFLFGGSS